MGTWFDIYNSLNSAVQFGGASLHSPRARALATRDAEGGQTEIVKAIRDQGSGYLLAVIQIVNPETRAISEMACIGRIRLRTDW